MDRTQRGEEPIFAPFLLLTLLDRPLCWPIKIDDAISRYKPFDWSQACLSKTLRLRSKIMKHDQILLYETRLIA